MERERQKCAEEALKGNTIGDIRCILYENATPHPYVYWEDKNILEKYNTACRRSRERTDTLNLFNDAPKRGADRDLAARQISTRMPAFGIIIDLTL